MKRSTFEFVKIILLTILISIQMLHGLIGLAAASMFTKVTGIGDSDTTFFAWIAWRILGVAAGVASTYLIQADATTGMIAAFALATVAIDVAKKVKGLMSS